MRHGNQIFISGQIPRVGNTVVVTGRVGDVVTLERAQLAAKICAMRALALLAQALGSLENIEKVLRGFTRARPLEGGLDGWKAGGYLLYE
jgi:enamine deaminase RidA (YjgF/YER057c/UK114 family)